VNGSDVRDEPLGEALDGVVRSMVPEPSFDRVMRRGSRRRLARLAAAYAMVAVFVVGAVWAGALVRSGREAPPVPASIVTFTSSEVPWTFELPSDWNSETTRSEGPELRVNVLRTTVANHPLPEGVSAFGPNSGADDPVVSALGDDGAAVIVRRLWGHAAPLGCDEWGPRAFADDASNPGWEFRERHRSEGTLCFAVLEWFGPEASAEDRAAAGVVADSVRLADLERWSETDGERITLHDEDDGFAVTYPADWITSDEPINAWVSSPFEILALATYPPRPGGEAVADFQLPSNAIEDLGPNDILIWVNESGDAGGFAKRPLRFEPSEPCGGDDWTRLCQEPSGDTSRLSIPGIHAWWFGFHDAGRGFYVFVGMGEQAYRDQARAGLAWEVLDSLRFLPR
jgi:hypothetical protein